METSENRTEIALEELDENTNKSTKFCFNKRTKWKYDKSTKFWLKVWQDWALAREYDVDIEKYPIFSCSGGSSNFVKISKHHSYY
jgi:hypothetical protein